ncbi:hypothetical protein [Halobacteriovorax sp. ZH1_bin.1]|uniref:hypothetical protein n=1 Tax=Halobacteriovorax sp. ZH1_bin.1 TaxID=3157723 RepID=UPI00371D6008
MKYFALTLSAIVFIYTALIEHRLNAQTISDSIITDPSISRRCDSLMNQRQEKVEHRQRLLFLLDRNKNLLKSTPENKKSISSKLRDNQYRVIQELKITNLKVIKLEEQIVRRGCPGLTI